MASLGGSRVQIGGPTGAFVVIVYGIVQKFGIEGLYISTFVAGILLVLLGLFRVGSMIKFMPEPVIMGFTSGIAVIIFCSQIKDFFGLKMGTVPAEFFQKWTQFAQHFNSINLAAVFISVGTILLILGWGRINKHIPGQLVALIVFTLLAHFLGLHVETIGSRFGDIPHNFPKPVIPNITLETLIPLVPSIFAVTLLGAIESLLSAVVADGMIGGEHRPNMEFVAQGFANVTSPIFGGIPVTGAIARTATNVHSGGRTPVAGIIHSVVLLLIMLFLGEWVKYIPLSCLAGILVLISYKMGDWGSFQEMLKDSRTSMIIIWATFLITVAIDLTAGILVGTILAIILRGFIKYKIL